MSWQIQYCLILRRHREAMRLEGWAPVVMSATFRDVPGVYPEVLEGALRLRLSYCSAAHDAPLELFTGGCADPQG